MPLPESNTGCSFVSWLLMLYKFIIKQVVNIRNSLFPNYLLWLTIIYALENVYDHFYLFVLNFHLVRKAEDFCSLLWATDAQSQEPRILSGSSTWMAETNVQVQSAAPHDAYQQQAGAKAEWEPEPRQLQREHMEIPSSSTTELNAYRYLCIESVCWKYCTSFPVPHVANLSWQL